MLKVGRCLLADRLHEAKMTQQELAHRIGVPRQRINAYVHNRKMMSFERAVNIAMIIGCPITSLYEWIRE